MQKLNISYADLLCRTVWEKLTDDGGSEEADCLVGCRAGGVEGLNQVVGEGERDHGLTSRLHDQQRRPESAAEVSHLEVL